MRFRAEGCSDVLSDISAPLPTSRSVDVIVSKKHDMQLFLSCPRIALGPVNEDSQRRLKLGDAALDMKGKVNEML